MKALFRSRGVRVGGKSIYHPTKRDDYLRALPTSGQAAAHLLFAQYDAVSLVRDKAHEELVAESHKHAVTKQLESCPGLGEIRAAQVVSVVVTPERFRTRQQFWAYCGWAS